MTVLFLIVKDHKYIDPIVWSIIENWTNNVHSGHRKFGRYAKSIFNSIIRLTIGHKQIVHS